MMVLPPPQKTWLAGIAASKCLKFMDAEKSIVKTMQEEESTISLLRTAA